MSKRLRHVSEEEKKEDHLTISKHNTKASSISVDLIIEILSSLPAKSIARLLCLSKYWSSLLKRQYFTDLFLTKSLTRPRRLLFTFQKEDKWFFFSAPQYLDYNSSTTLVVDKHKCFTTVSACLFYIHPPVHGLICNESKSMMICNPSTGQSITLPKVRTRRNRVRTFLGYDPINKQFKVLSMSLCRHPRIASEHQVLTLGNGTLSWRMVECSLHDYPTSGGICINGVLYYSAYTGHSAYIVIGFDVLSEKFKRIDIGLGYNANWQQTLINYKGKLGVIQFDWFGCLCNKTTSLELWVIDDAEERILLKQIYALPPLWDYQMVSKRLNVVGMTSNGEVVFSTPVPSDRFYVIYYNVEENTIARVKIQGTASFNPGQYMYTFMDHFEDVKPM